MGLLTTNSDYSDRDFASLLARMRSLIGSVFPTWTDDEVANFGNLLVELYCWVGDVLNFYQDNQAAEAFLATATQRKNLLALVKLIGYEPSGATAATADVTFTLAAAVPVGRTVTFRPPATPTPINETICKTLDAETPVTFQLLGDLVLAAGATSGTGTVEHSEVQDPEVFTSSGLPDQEVVLSQTPYLDGSAEIQTGGGVYTEVAGFLQSTSSDRHFMVTVDANDQATIRFGNGASGMIPVGSITVVYKTGGGLGGNVAANTIVKLEGSFVDSAGDPVTVTITNPTAAAGGIDRESNEQIKERAPESLVALTRTVSREDFEINAKLYTGIERALMLTKNEDGAIAENAGSLYVVPAGIGFPSTTLKNAVLAHLLTDYPPVITFSPTVVDPIYVDIGVKANIFLRQGYDAATVRAEIIANLVAFFALRNDDGTTNTLIDFGWNLKTVTGAAAGEIALSDVFDVVRDHPGVRKVDDGIGDFQLKAYRVIAATTHYTGGGVNATLVQALAHTDVPVQVADFPRLKMTVLGGAIADVDLTIDGVNYPAG